MEILTKGAAMLRCVSRIMTPTISTPTPTVAQRTHHSTYHAWCARSVAMLLILCGVAFSGSVAAITVPDGFRVVAETDGATCYRKDYPGGQPDFVVVVDLRRARFTSMVGDTRDPRIGVGPLGGNDPVFARLTLRQFWDRAVASDARTFAVVNGQFFANAGTEAPLAFSIHADDAHVTDGYGITSEFPGEIELLEVTHRGARASISSFHADAFRASGGSDHRVAGLSTFANKGPATYTGRTFLGIHDASGDGHADTLLIFASAYANQPGAREVLQAFGATQQVMLDGGGSTQLIVAGESYVTSSRTIPHAFAVISAPPPSCEDACVDGARRCTGARAVERCARVDGACTAWSTAETCGADESCVGEGQCLAATPAALGDLCMHDVDCGAAWTCDLRWPLGSCTQPCATAASCGAGARCVMLGGAGVCARACGTCPAGSICRSEVDVAGFAVEVCAPDCGASPSACGSDAACTASGRCEECSCDGRACGVNPCGASCGTCPSGHRCSPSFRCVDSASVCGSDPSNCTTPGEGRCGSDHVIELCLTDPDGCSRWSVARDCGEVERCIAPGRCESDSVACPMARDCTGLECGPDAYCGLSCGTCAPGSRCRAGLCEVPDDTPSHNDASDDVSDGDAIAPDSLTDARAQGDVADASTDDSITRTTQSGCSVSASLPASSAAAAWPTRWGGFALVLAMVALSRRQLRHARR